MEAGEKTKKGFGKRLRQYRKRAGLSPDQFAFKLKIHRNTVYHLERGKQWIGADLLEKVAEVLEVDPAVLFSDEVIRVEPTIEEALAVVSNFVETKRKKRATVDRETAKAEFAQALIKNGKKPETA